MYFGNWVSVMIRVKLKECIRLKFVLMRMFGI